MSTKSVFTSVGGSGRARGVAPFWALLAVPAVLLFPFLILGVASLAPLDWQQMSLVGQAYGGAAALLTVVTLAGLVSSLLLQARALRLQTEQVARERQQDLVQLVLTNPQLKPGSPFADVEMTPEMIYAGLWFSYFGTFFQLGYLQEEELRLELRHMFNASPVCIARWEYARDLYAARGRSFRGVNFVDVVDDEVDRARRHVVSE